MGSSPQASHSMTRCRCDKGSRLLGCRSLPGSACSSAASFPGKGRLSPGLQQRANDGLRPHAGDHLRSQFEQHLSPAPPPPPPILYIQVHGCCFSRGSGVRSPCFNTAPAVIINHFSFSHWSYACLKTRLFFSKTKGVSSEHLSLTCSIYLNLSYFITLPPYHRALSSRGAYHRIVSSISHRLWFARTLNSTPTAPGKLCMYNRVTSRLSGLRGTTERAMVGSH